jgi:hypothetical protein
LRGTVEGMVITGDTIGRVVTGDTIGMVVTGGSFGRVVTVGSFGRAVTVGTIGMVVTGGSFGRGDRHGVKVSVDNLFSGSMSKSTPLRQTVTGSLSTIEMFTCWAIVV